MGQNSSHHRGSSTRTPPSTNYDLPALKFHATHGDNIVLREQGFEAERRESYCKGILFSHRPVMVGERVCLRINELSSRWSGVIRVGFASHDPAGLAGSLPKYACPNLTHKAGFWAKALSDRCIDLNAVIHYYVSGNGDVHFGINGSDLGVFFSGVDTRQPLWAMIDLYGNCTAIELIDPRRPRYSQIREPNSIGFEERSRHAEPSSRTFEPLATANSRPFETNPHAYGSNSRTVEAHSRAYEINAQHVSANSQPVDNHPRRLESNLRPVPAGSASSEPLPPVRYNRATRYRHLELHRRVGRNVTLNETATVASRATEEFSHGYVFSRRTIAPGESVTIQVLSNEEAYIGSLAFGLTNCDPEAVDVHELPEDSDLLIDRPEYWVVSKDVANSPAVGDELTFKLGKDGSVEFRRNDRPPSTFMHVDTSQPLWAFWDIYGHTSAIRLLGSTVADEDTLAIPPEAFDEDSPSECTVCYERPVDCVLYTCGHMCMCYDCAMQQWRGRGGGFCPMCRMAIRDVIKTFRS